LRAAVYYPYILKELQHRRNRTLVNILGIAVGIALFVSINATSAAYKKAVNQPFKNLGADLVVQRTIKKTVDSGQAPRTMRGIRLPFSNQLLSPKDLQGLHGIEGVDSAAYSLLLWEFAPRGFRTIMGMDPEHPDLGPVKVKDWLEKGRFPEKQGEVVLEKHFAKFNHVHLGDIFKISGRPFRVVGLLEIKEGSQIAATNMYLPLEAAQTLLEGGANAVNMVYLRLKNPSMVNRVKSQISRQIRGVSVSSSDSFLELMGGVSMISSRFSLMASLAALIGAVLLIMKTMLSNLLERSKEIGILKAVGWSHGEVQKQLMGEVFVQAIVGGLLGVLIGYIISYLLGFLSISIPVPWNLNPLPAMAKQAVAAAHVVRLPVKVSFRLASTSIALALMVGCVTGYVLGRRTVKMKPADILRQL
jgi:ABC-type antimicrobial peptide transport system permease subunit